MAVRVRVENDGKPVAECDTAQEAVEFMRLLSSQPHATDRSHANGAGRVKKIKPEAAIDNQQPHSIEHSGDMDGRVRAVLSDLKPGPIKVLAELCNFEKGINTGELSTILGVDKNSLGGSCTSISRAAKRQGLSWNQLVVSKPAFSGGERVHTLKP